MSYNYYYNIYTDTESTLHYYCRKNGRLVLLVFLYFVALTPLMRYIYIFLWYICKSIIYTYTMKKLDNKCTHTHTHNNHEWDKQVTHTHTHPSVQGMKFRVGIVYSIARSVRFSLAALYWIEGWPCMPPSTPKGDLVATPCRYSAAAATHTRETLHRAIDRREGGTHETKHIVGI